MMDKVKRKKDLCCFCGIGDDHELELGKMYNLENISVHYYCLLFSSGLPQNGDDDEGIMGFLAKDIEKEVQRGRKLSCSYCLKKGATIGCSEKKCRRTYHYHCGLKHYAVCRFSNDFRSYCVQHRKFQKGSGIGEELKCPICMEELIVDPKTAVWAPCCKRKSWFHKICLQRLALSAGYFFKCPLCNNQDKFLLEMQNVGIFVPEKDASWELEPNAFRELHERPLHCDASKCKCPDGRKTDVEGSRWEILLCNLCGSSGVHIACGGLSFSSTEWTCTVCAEMLAKSGKCMQQKVQERHLKEKNVKIEQDLLESECTSSITTVCKSSSHDKICVIKSDCSSEDTIIDVGDWNHTPCKRKLEVMGRSKETLAKVCHFDGVGTESIINVDDSDEEIDIKSGEYHAPPYTVIRKLEEHGTELPKELEMIKKHALRAQERMLELCLTESEIVKMAKESSQFKGFSLNESDIISFYKYNLPLEKMLQVQKLVTTIFALKKNVSEVQPSSIRKQNKIKAVIPRIRKSRRKSVIGTQNVSVPPIKISVTQSSISVERIPNDIEESVQKENSSLRDSWSISNENPVDMKFSSTVECEDEQQEMNEDIKVEGRYVSKSLNAFNESVSPLYINSVRDSPPATQPFEKQSGVSNAHHTSLPLIFVSPLSNKFLSLMAQESSTSDEIMENQAARDKENTIRNQKDNEGMNQEACTSGACRKLLLEPESCAEMSDECDNPTPLEFSDRCSSPEVHQVNIQDFEFKMVDPQHVRNLPKSLPHKMNWKQKIPSSDSLLDQIKVYEHQTFKLSCQQSDIFQVQLEDQQQTSSEKIIGLHDMITRKKLKLSKEIDAENSMRNSRNSFKSHPYIFNKCKFYNSQFRNTYKVVEKVELKSDRPLLIQEHGSYKGTLADSGNQENAGRLHSFQGCDKKDWTCDAARTRLWKPAYYSHHTYSTEMSLLNKVSTETNCQNKLGMMQLNMRNIKPCLWKVNSVKEKEQLKSDLSLCKNASLNDTNICDRCIMTHSNSTLTHSSSETMSICQSCVVVLQRLPSLSQARRISVVTDNIVKICFKKTFSEIQIPPPALIKKLYVSGSHQ
ncbi:uncharacterized protein [Panulirus ornatus]